MNKFYTCRKQLTTLKARHHVLTDEIQFPGKYRDPTEKDTTNGIHMEKIRDTSKVLLERPNIVALRLSFYHLKNILKVELFSLS